MNNATLVTATREQLEPLLQAVIDELDEDANTYPMVFFVQALLKLRAVEEEAALMQLFFELSATAFQGFAFTAEQARRVDALLARCEAIALTLSASDADRH